MSELLDSGMVEFQHRRGRLFDQLLQLKKVISKEENSPKIAPSDF
jgi:hypothetical protein